jgi:2-polyprenyl-6-methoxyphenol hydroxylase-like FAD-dependent oxidoreductase
MVTGGRGRWTRALARIALVGTGYAGLSAAIALGKKGNTIACADSDLGKLETLSRGQSPTFEKRLNRDIASLVRRHRLQPTSETASAVRESEADRDREDRDTSSSHGKAGLPSAGSGIFIGRWHLGHSSTVIAQATW